MNNKFYSNPTIYHLLVDRYASLRAGETESKRVGRVDDGLLGSFHGGCFSGVAESIRQGWLCQLGVNAILISAPYEQIRGWVPGAGRKFKHFSYHGYYALDYTTTDPRFGTEQEFCELVESAHAKGIAVLMDVVMNHPGYPDLQSLHDLGIDALRPGWKRAGLNDYESYLDVHHPSLNDWWGPSWVRANLPGYPPGGRDDHSMLLSGLPDFRTESEAHVTLPTFLRNKPDTRAIDLPNTTVRGYLIDWLTRWVRDYGIDGFRCDSAKHVEPETWVALKEAAMTARAQWLERQPDGAFGDSAFWMMGEVFGLGVEPSPYFDHGFDSLINFSFQDSIEQDVPLDDVYQAYASHLNGRPEQNFISYLSSHDTHLFDRHKLIEGATALMLAPGGVLMLYGDETARPPGVMIEEDPAQATRSPMNWSSIDTEVLDHWRKLGQFRARHAAIARGTHLKLADSPYTFSRFDTHDDRVVVAMQVHGEALIPVGAVFDDGTALRDAYSGWSGVVDGGCVRLNGQGVVLLEPGAKCQAAMGTAT